MLNVDVEVIGTRVILDFCRLMPDSETLAERVREVLPLLVFLISADNAWRNLSDEDRVLRMHAAAAIDMKTQAVLLAAQAQAELQVAVIDGRLSIAEHGFPEFHAEGTQDD